MNNSFVFNETWSLQQATEYLMAQHQQTLLREAVLEESINIGYIIICSALIFFMQAGFAMLEVGTVTSSHATNILFKNVLDIPVSALGFWTIGYGFAYGAGSFVGITQYFLVDAPQLTAGLDTYLFFVFQLMFASASATIVSGAIAERVKFQGYLAVAFGVVAVIWPFVAHWVWAPEGFLGIAGNPAIGVGMIDFAGSGVVHMVGGFVGLVGAKLVGFRNQDSIDKEKYPPRFYYDDDAKEWSMNQFPPTSEVFSTLGVLILWFGWFAFNCGSVVVLNGAGVIASRVAINSVLCPAAGSITVVAIGRYSSKLQNFNLSDSLNGILAGLVGITAGCSVVNPLGSIIIGVISGFVYKGTSKVLIKFRIDDPLDAAPVHGFVGAWGLICIGFFADPAYVSDVYGVDAGGLFWGKSDLIGPQIVGTLIIAIWSMVLGALMFLLMKFIDKSSKSNWFFETADDKETLTFGADDYINPLLTDFVIPSGIPMMDTSSSKGKSSEGSDSDSDGGLGSSSSMGIGGSDSSSTSEGRNVTRSKRNLTSPSQTPNVDDKQKKQKSAQMKDSKQKKSKNNDETKGKPKKTVKTQAKKSDSDSSSSL